VAELARAFATEMNLPIDQIDGIRMAAAIHDLGKISVPAEILSKPTKLTNLEFSLIKTHAQSGYDILKDIEFPWPIAKMVLEHHERMNGSGYPNGLTGDNILMESRILAVADVVESMASHRPYRSALGIDKALEEIEKNRGTLYDNAVADACLRLFREKGYQLQDASF
jgi:HD-GYP domain-containing protein (c-di-GMP phosphodiesterase class II)